jgi:sigma-B regulation protein RsbU (phosphoserine phosphatase)
MNELEVECETMQLEPNDTLVLYTDGVTEAFNAEGAVFHESGLLACVAQVGQADACATVATIVSAVRRHAAECPPSDDLTVVALRRRS